MGKFEQLECDILLIERYLDECLDPEEEGRLETHLAQCPACRNQITQSAARADLWQDASRYLQADQWDGDFGSAPPRTSPDGDAADEVLSCRIRDWLDASDDPRMIGRFAGYEVVGIVGHGGMGVVLKALEPALNRYVAVKVLAPHLAASGAARQRFAREAQAAAAVLHENVIAIHRVSEASGVPYLVMPYIAGTSLAKRLADEGPLPVPAILRIARQIAEGLAAAHAQGLVHRDIKPANILLERGVERITITDFGLARAADDAALTRSGMIAGTPQFMSPEQARGETLDARSDLFSLGSILYAMCTGRLPFRAETSYGVLHRVTTDTPRAIRERNPDIPPWLCRIVERLHAKQPAHRYQRASQVAELLAQCLTHLQTPHHPLPRELRESRTRTYAVPALVAAAVIAIGGVVRMSGSQNRTPPADAPVDRAASAMAAPDAEGNNEYVLSEGDPGDEELHWNDSTELLLEQVRQHIQRLEQE